MLIGMIHLPPLPGSPLYTGQDIDEIISHACEDLSALLEGGIDSAMIENYGDVPFCRDKIPRETMAAMSIAVREISRFGGQKLRFFGVNVLRNDWESAIAIAAAVKADFMRINILTGVAVTDQGIIQGGSFNCLNYRKKVHPDLKILADIFVKHSTPLAVDPDVVLEDTVKDTVYRGQADGLIVSGSRTGLKPDISRVKRVSKTVPGVPILIGSGLTVENASELLQYTSGAIVGTSIKSDGKIDVKKVSNLIKVVNSL